MGADEAGTLERLKSFRKELVQPKIKECSGRIVTLMALGFRPSLRAPSKPYGAPRHLAHFTMEDDAEAHRLITEGAQTEPDRALALGDLAES